MLQQFHRGCLVDHGSAGATPDTALVELTLRRHRGQAFVEVARRVPGQSAAASAAPYSRASSAAGPSRSARVRGSPTTDPDRLVLGDQAGQLGEVGVGARIAGQRRHRHGEHAARVAARDADPDGADVDAEPDAGVRLTSPVSGVGP